MGWRGGEGTSDGFDAGEGGNVDSVIDVDATCLANTHDKGDKRRFGSPIVSCFVLCEMRVQCKLG